MTDYGDWKITLPFSVPAGDEDGAFTEALFEAALRHAPSQAEGMVARADTRGGKGVDRLHARQRLAREVGRTMRRRVRETVLSGDDVCVTDS